MLVSPVIEALSLEKSDYPPRLWWCPIGFFTSLPLHAAGAGLVSASDFVVSSYVVSLDGLIPSKLSKEKQAAFNILAVSQKDAPGASPLPSTVEEVEKIRQIAPSDAFVSLEGPSATVEKVLYHLAHSRWLHLACHGVQDVSLPLDSAFLLHDKRLKLSTIMQQSLPNAEFAFLSACQTATGDKGLPDEATHLAAGLLFAGFRGVIATLWSIADADGLVVAEFVYDYMLNRASQKQSGVEAEWGLA